MAQAGASTRTMWKGAVSFGLVHIPVALYTATAETRPKFNLIDKESMSPVGNKQVSKSTGEAVQQQDLVKGLKVDEGRYVVLSKEEIRSALPRATQMIEIERFVDIADIPSVFYQKPYYVAPGTRGHKAFILLRDTLRKTGKAGLARVVVSTKQHLAALMPLGNSLVLNLLRWEEEVRAAPAGMPDVGEVAPTDRELRMAQQLVEDLSEGWEPGLFRDEFKEQLEALVEQKSKAGEVTAIDVLPGQELPPATADVVDLTELLRRSLGNRADKQEGQEPAFGRGDAANDETSMKRAAAAKSEPKSRSVVKPKPRKKSG